MNSEKNWDFINTYFLKYIYSGKISFLGNKVHSFDLDNSGVLDIITSDFTSGIYFGNLIVNKRVVSVKKLIIN